MKHNVSSFVFAGILSSVSAQSLAAEDATNTLVNIDINPDLLNEISLALPERQDVNQAFLSNEYSPNIILQEDAHVSVTFLDEGAGYRNSLGYFTYEASTFENISFGQIDADGSGHIGISELQNISGVNTGMIFNNASESGGGGSLLAGDTVTLTGADIVNVDGDHFDMTGGTRFEAGTNVGFFLLQNAWDGSQVKGWDYTSQDPLAMYTLDFLNPENNFAATLDNSATYSRHVAMMNSISGDNEIILGFEDLVRPQGDNDFNDAVFLVRTDPVTSLFAEVPTTEEVISLQAAPGPSMGGGLSGLFALALGFLSLRRKQ
ncbi:DUF4114 domain-containing protein [Neptuniibacter caesariensis]|uniref:DUF4114 domain-containing protein n=1 Tax=Neptuniibacter caesariensis TaxID=207954 RepID=A0A7U8GTD1_NEPCE|nr:DUF4114 domain-containing protein [Neptuniibacter caesariensis]EAR62020.1 hypothetical protein MED92_09954 [Oceanospirillum sp. MED92] [Neptuniibacter caesariensis]